MWRVLTWNLYHGRAQPPAGHDLLDDFALALAGWEWDVALLQEVPPWWPAPLAHAAGASPRSVLTSRNGMLPLRRAIATRRPDLIKSHGGGANVALVRGGVIAEQRSRRLCLLPERRWLQALRLQDGRWIGNLHATAHNPSAALHDSGLAATTMLRWARGSPLVLGGDFNVRALTLPGLHHAGGHDVDHLFAAGLHPVRAPVVLEHGRLSDHAPILFELAENG